MNEETYNTIKAQICSPVDAFLEAIELQHKSTEVIERRWVEYNDPAYAEHYREISVKVCFTDKAGAHTWEYPLDFRSNAAALTAEIIADFAGHSLALEKLLN